MKYSEKRCIKFLNKLAEFKESMNELTKGDIEALHLISLALEIEKRKKRIEVKK